MDLGRAYESMPAVVEPVTAAAGRTFLRGMAEG